MKDELKPKLHFTTSGKPKECEKCQWGHVEPFDSFDGKRRYGVCCYIPDLEAMKGECPQKIAPSKIKLRFYQKPADRIHAVYNAKEYTMSEISENCNIEHFRVSEIVNGYQRPSTSELEKICRFLNMSAREYELLSLEYNAIDKAIIKQAKKLEEEA